MARVKGLLQSAQEKARQNLTPGVPRTWQDILLNRNANSNRTNSSALDHALIFRNKNGTNSSVTGTRREYHGPSGPPGPKGAAVVSVFPSDRNAAQSQGERSSAPVSAAWRRTPYAGSDQDADGLPDDFEGQVADNFTPYYGVSAYEADSFALFGDYVPQTVTQLTGAVPPTSYFRVQPLGLATDAYGNQYFALRIDYLTLWNADDGLIGGGEFCAYSYFGLDEIVQTLTGHNLDNERSAMLVAAPAVGGGFNPDPNAYSLYSAYLSAHEGTFFDQSVFVDFGPPVPAGNHLILDLSLSKHSTYGFNPDFYPLFPYWFIAGTYAGLFDAWVSGFLTDDEFFFLLFLADDIFFGCVVERFFDQGHFFAQTRINIGEPNQPINACGFIQDNTAHSFFLYQKLTTPLF